MLWSKCIEIIGEAASKISSEFKSKYPQIPWRDIISMRNYLIHVYFDVDNDVTWDTVIIDVPELLKLIKVIDLEK